MQSLWYAYEAVVEEEMKRLTAKKGGLVGKEITRAEKENNICRAESEFQLDALKKAGSVE